LRETRSEGLLFPEKIYEYFCYCTTLEEAPVALHRLYGDRGECENWIQHLSRHHPHPPILGQRHAVASRGAGLQPEHLATPADGHRRLAAGAAHLPRMVYPPGRKTGLPCPPVDPQDAGQL